MISPVVQPPSLALLALAASTWLVWSGATPPAPTTPSTAQHQEFPRQLGAWQGKPLEDVNATAQIIGTPAIGLMEYRRGESEPPIWFFHVVGFGRQEVFHPPELCYLGSHYEILEQGVVSVTVNGAPQTVKRLLISQHQERFEVWYWLTANGRMTPSYSQQQLWLLGELVKANPTVGTLVRLVTPLDHPGRAHDRLVSFLAVLTAAQHKLHVETS